MVHGEIELQYKTLRKNQINSNNALDFRSPPITLQNDHSRLLHTNQATDGNRIAIQRDAPQIIMQFQVFEDFQTNQTTRDGLRFSTASSKYGPCCGVE